MTFIALITANIFLTLVNRSFYYSIFTTLRYRNGLVILVIGITVILNSTAIRSSLRQVLSFQKPATGKLFISMFAGLLCVIWFEIVKLFVGRKHP